MKTTQAGILSAFLLSICCVGPLLLAIVGLEAGAALIGRYHWLFLISGIAVLAWAWIKYLRGKCVCAREGRRQAMLSLSVTTIIVLAFAALNVSRYAVGKGIAPAQVETPLANGLKRIIIPIKGMSCAACEVPVRYSLKSVNGVESARVSAAAGTATVDYDPAKTNPDQLVTAINSTGYHATPLSASSNSTGTTTPSCKAPAWSTTTAEQQSHQERNIRLHRTSLFKVSLQCPAAPQIGCGSASRPILLRLEREPGVAQAWLNRAGTQIAVVWKPEADAAVRHNVAGKLGDDAKELEGEPGAEALKSFLSGKGWYRGAEVNRLSEEEAGIIAARLVRRVETKTPLSKEKAVELRLALTQLLDKCLTSGDSKSRFLEDVASKYLKREQLKILKEAIENGVRPLPNES
jgi:copper chaperone CopZ